MFRKMLSISLLITTPLVFAACQLGDPDEPDEQARLQALLEDAPLAQIPLGATTASVRGDSDHDNIVLQSVNPLGVWDFEDCSSFRTNLSDSSFNNNTAFRSVGVVCTDGIRGSRGVSILFPEDLVYVPDQPNFTFENGVTVAGWFKPAVASGTKTLFRRRDKGTSSFALVMSSGKFEFVVNLGNGTAISVVSPAKATLGVYQHVAATYDGATARLYVDGLEVSHVDAAGAIPVGPGPLLMGNDGSERRFLGAMDSALFATHAITPAEVQALNCFPQSPTVVVSSTNLTTPPGVPATIDIALTNRNPAACAPITITLNAFNFDSRLTLDPSLAHSAPLASGQTGHMTLTATPADSVDPGTNFFLEFELTEPVTNLFNFQFANLTVSEPTGCHVNTPRELMVKATSVVEDPVRTVFNASSTDARNGVWTFKHLMENMAPTPADAPAMAEAMLASFTTPQTINGFTIAARPGMQNFVLSRWPRTASGALDLARAPLRLMAIVNRFDLRDLANGDAGEARFVFGFVDSSGFFPLQATMILEYKLPAATDQDVLDWAQAFHGLGALAFGESYNAALQVITERFAGRNARPGHPNGSAINTVRTNEIDFSNDFTWQMRQFQLSPTSGLLEPAPLALTPDRSFDGSSTLASYINGNQSAIIAEQHTVPLAFDGQPFQAGAVVNNLNSWFAPGANNEARHHFALNTCNGCHSSQETNTFFLQIQPRFPGNESSLSGFLTGTTVFDPVTFQQRAFNDLARRKADLTAIVCPAPAAPASPAQTTLRKGISRVH